MSDFSVPTLPTIISRIRADLNAYLGTTRALVRWTLEYALAPALAYAVSALYRYAANRADATMPDLATGDDLDRHLEIWGIARTAATKATGTAALTGGAGLVVPAGTILVREDGWRYTTTADCTLVGGAGLASLESVNAGVDGNADHATVVTLETPIAGVDSQGYLWGAATGGADEQTDDSVRAELLQYIRERPQGGADADYVSWVLETPGVPATDAWIVPWGNGAGSVVVYFAVEWDGVNPTSIVPTAPQVAAVQAYLTDPSRKPVTADVTVVAIAAYQVLATIAVLPNTAAVKAAVVASLDAMFLREADAGATIKNSVFRAAISAAAGETSHVLSSIIGDGTGLSDITLTASQVAVRGVITWV